MVEGWGVCQTDQELIVAVGKVAFDVSKPTATNDWTRHLGKSSVRSERLEKLAHAWNIKAVAERVVQGEGEEDTLQLSDTRGTHLFVSCKV